MSVNLISANWLIISLSLNIESIPERMEVGSFGITGGFCQMVLWDVELSCFFCKLAHLNIIEEFIWVLCYLRKRSGSWASCMSIKWMVIFILDKDLKFFFKVLTKYIPCCKHLSCEQLRVMLDICNDSRQRWGMPHLVHTWVRNNREANRI